jgi:hypothetical protein
MDCKASTAARLDDLLRRPADRPLDYWLLIEACGDKIVPFFETVYTMYCPDRASLLRSSLAMTDHFKTVLVPFADPHKKVYLHRSLRVGVSLCRRN